MGIGLSPGGNLRLNYQGGDFSKQALQDAIFKGKGFEKPRLMGAAFLGLGLAFGIINSVMLFVLHYYFPYLFMIAAPFGWAGLWLLITGQPAATPDGSPAPMWGRIGLGVCFAIGILLGIGSILAVHF
jgi:hypothetical protein